MKTFPTAKIRNVALVGHGGAGKTSLAEALLFAAGAIPRLGQVEDGTTVCDFDPEEQRRRISVSLALAPFELDGHKVNVLDTPGYADFVGDVAAALQAADLALFVVSAVEGVEVQTEIAWKLAEQRGIPRAIFVNKLDRERASFARTLDQLKEKFGAGVAPLAAPDRRGRRRSAASSSSSTTTRSPTPAASPKGTDGPIPAEMETEEHAVHDALVEGIVVGDDDLMERYLGDEKIEITELAHALATGIAERHRVPGAVRERDASSIGIDRLAHFLVEEAPAPAVADGAAGRARVQDDRRPVRRARELLQGAAGHGEARRRARRTAARRPTSACTSSSRCAARSRTPVTEVAGRRHRRGRQARRHHAPATCSRAKGTDRRGRAARAARAGARGRDQGQSRRATRTSSPTRCTACRRRTRCCASSATRRRTRPCCAAWARRTSSIALEKLARKFGVEVDTEDVQVAYRETITGTAEAEGKLKKQTGGHGQFAVAWLRVEPHERGAGNEFVDAIVGGVIPRNFIPAVEKGVAETEEHGGALGFPVVDVKVTCFDGKHHPVDSSEMAFKTAASIGLRTRWPRRARSCSSRSASSS